MPFTLHTLMSLLHFAFSVADASIKTILVDFQRTFPFIMPLQLDTLAEIYSKYIILNNV